MITAVDTGVLLDVFSGDAMFGRRSEAALVEALSEGGLVACDVVWAEVSARFPSSDAASAAMQRLGVSFAPLDAPSALAAGACWRRYRERGGSRDRVIADFLIGAHASLSAGRLLTRDRGFYRSYFADLRILDPSASDR